MEIRHAPPQHLGYGAEERSLETVDRDGGDRMSEEREAIVTSVCERLARLARDPGREKTFPVGPESAKRLGCAAQAVDASPRSATESFAGVGKPLSLGTLQPGDSVLDAGCGAGMDSLLAAQAVGPSGKVIGVDMVPEMLSKAQHNAQAVGVTNVEFLPGSADALPVADDSVDVIITNGVLNPCLDKPTVLAEVFCVWRPGGRLQVADILLEAHVMPEEVASKGAWSD
jgi:SAM-dependent methyltransferase